MDDSWSRFLFNAKQRNRSTRMGQFTSVEIPKVSELPTFPHKCNSFVSWSVLIANNCCLPNFSKKHQIKDSFRSSHQFYTQGDGMVASCWSLGIRSMIIMIIIAKLIFIILFRMVALWWSLGIPSMIIVIVIIAKIISIILFRVMEWLRHVDLSEYAPNLRGSGVHGALLVLEARWWIVRFPNPLATGSQLGNLTRWCRS